MPSCQREKICSERINTLWLIFDFENHSPSILPCNAGVSKFDGYSFRTLTATERSVKLSEGLTDRDVYFQSLRLKYYPHDPESKLHKTQYELLLSKYAKDCAIGLSGFAMAKGRSFFHLPN